MLLVVSSKMLAKTHLVGSNCRQISVSWLNRESTSFPIFMPRNQISAEEMKVRVLKLKHQLDTEQQPDGSKYLTNKYLNKVLDIINEYRY